MAKGSGHGQVKPGGILPPQFLKRVLILGGRLPRGALTDSHKQASASALDRLRRIRQHGCTLPIPIIRSIMLRILPHIRNWGPILRGHVPSREGGGGGGDLGRGTGGARGGAVGGNTGGTLFGGAAGGSFGGETGGVRGGEVGGILGGDIGDVCGGAVG